MTPLRRGLGVGAALALVATAVAILLAWQQIGWPDGHLTDLDRARTFFYPAAAAVAAALGALVGWVTLRHPRKLRVAVLATLIGLVLIAMVDAWLAASFDHGRGG